MIKVTDHYISINISNEHRSIVRHMYLCKRCSLEFIDWFREVDNGKSNSSI